jgi:hypothetical protein
MLVASWRLRPSGLAVGESKNPIRGIFVEPAQVIAPQKFSGAALLQFQTNLSWKKEKSPGLTGDFSLYMAQVAGMKATSELTT